MGNSATRRPMPPPPQIQGPAAWITHDVIMAHVLDDALPAASVAALARTCKYYANLVREHPALLLGDAVQLRFYSARGDPYVEFITRRGRWRCQYCPEAIADALPIWLEWIRRGRACSSPGRRVHAELAVPRAGLAVALSALNPRAVLAPSDDRAVAFDSIKVAEWYPGMEIDCAVGLTGRSWTTAIPEYASAFSWRGASYQEYVAAAHRLFERATEVHWDFNPRCCYPDFANLADAFTRDLLSLLCKTRDAGRWSTTPVPTGKWNVRVPKRDIVPYIDPDDVLAEGQRVATQIESVWPEGRCPVAIWQNAEIVIRRLSRLSGRWYRVPRGEVAGVGTLSIEFAVGGAICIPETDLDRPLKRIDLRITSAPRGLSVDYALRWKLPDVRWRCTKLRVSVESVSWHSWAAAIVLSMLAVAPTRVLALTARNVFASRGQHPPSVTGGICVRVPEVGYFVIVPTRFMHSDLMELRAIFLGPDEVLQTKAYDTVWRQLGLALMYVAPCLVDVVGRAPSCEEARAALGALETNPILKSVYAAFGPFRRYIIAAEDRVLRQTRAAAAARIRKRTSGESL